MIHVWAALESMAARLATLNASDEALKSLRPLMEANAEHDASAGYLDEYSDANVEFHQTIIGLGRSELLEPDRYVVRSHALDSGPDYR